MKPELGAVQQTLFIPLWDGEEPEGSLDGAKARLGRLRPGEQFAYTFDLGDNWQHLCTVAPQRADQTLSASRSTTRSRPAAWSRPPGSNPGDGKAFRTAHLPGRCCPRV